MSHNGENACNILWTFSHLSVQMLSGVISISLRTVFRIRELFLASSFNMADNMLPFWSAICFGPLDILGSQLE